MENQVNIKVRDYRTHKIVRSEDFNMYFDKTDGTTLMCGRTPKEDPIMCKAGPILCDIEVTTICQGISSKGPCSFCYKSNTQNGSNMSFETFGKIIDTLPSTVTQVALGADAQCKSNPDIWDMMWYCRDNGIIPNITVAEVDRETAIKLSKVCGAVAVSYYGDWDVFFNTVTNLHVASKMEGATLKQVNVHQLVATETLENIAELHIKFDEYLRDKINAIVLLSLKQRGRGKHFNKVSKDNFKSIINHFDAEKIPYGFDSCSACKVADSLIELKGSAPLHLIESCESTLFSIFYAVDGSAYPCSFNEEPEYQVPLDKVDNFLEDVWFSTPFNNFRELLLKSKNSLGLCPCPTFEV